MQQSASGQGYNTHQTRHEINLYNFEVSIKVFGYRLSALTHKIGITKKCNRNMNVEEN